MTQQSYALQVIQHIGLEGCQPVSTPMVERVKLTLDMHVDTVNPTYYRSIVEKLIQLAHSLPDVSYSSYLVGIVSRFMMQPQIPHLIATKCILRYIVGTLDFGILSTTKSATFSGYVDKKIGQETYLVAYQQQVLNLCWEQAQ